VPGPGNYETHLVTKKAATTKFGSSEKLPASIGERNKTPGPGVYETIESSNKSRPSPPRFGFG
jgi:hypothetical protein